MLCILHTFCIIPSREISRAKGKKERDELIQFQDTKTTSSDSCKTLNSKVIHTSATSFPLSFILHAMESRQGFSAKKKERKKDDSQPNLN